MAVKLEKGEKFAFEREGSNKVYTIRNTKFVVPDRYIVTARLGSGSYGTVVSAIDTTTDAKVAIKKCQTVFKYPEDGKRVLREIKLMKQMDHRNVLTVNDALVPTASDFDDIYYVMDAMDTDLSNIIRSQTKLTEQHCKYIIYQILRALKYIHSADVLHRDLKPANILMNFDCRAKICDFGLARGFNPQQKGQHLTNYVVTRWYRAPELLLDNHNYNGAIDIWAAGCIFAEMLRTEALFPGDSSNAQLKLICKTIGVPAEDDLWWVASAKHKDYVVRLGQGQSPPDFASLLPAGTNPLAVDFLKHMLSFNPYKRWTADWLLDHPYLSDVHRPESCSKSTQTFKWKWDSNCPTAEELRHLFWEEILTFHPDIPRHLVPDTARPATPTAFDIATRKPVTTRVHSAARKSEDSSRSRNQTSANTSHRRSSTMAASCGGGAQHVPSTAAAVAGKTKIAAPACSERTNIARASAA